MTQGEVRPNVLRLALLAGVAAVVGSTPYLFYVRALWLLPLLAIGSAGTIWVSTRKLRTRATFEPTAGEWISAGWSLVGYAALANFALIYYAIAYWATRLVVYLLGQVDVQLDASWASTIGLALSGFFAAGGYAASLSLAVKLPQRLYPRLAGVRSPYYALWFTHRSWILVAVVAGLAALLAIVILDLREWYWILGCCLLLFYTGFPIASSGETRERRRKKGLEAVRLLMNATGWSVAPLHATGDPEVDPFTGEIDYIARRNGDSLLVEVVAAEVDWTVASGLQTAARILEDKLRMPEPGPGHLRPLLILVSDKIDESIRRFADIEEFDVAHVPEATVQTVLGAKNDAARLAALAQELMPATGAARA